MKFGLFGGPRSDDETGAAYRAGYNAYFDLVVEAEALGYYSAFLVEHHFSGMRQVSSSLNVLGHLAALTSTIRLGTAVVVLPWHNPILVAEQAATLDILSNGRFDFGVGRGYRNVEFEGFCIPIEEATERFEEAMQVIRAAFAADGRFSHHGKRWHYDNAVIEPKPLQQPHPPLWHAAGRPESLKYTAEQGYNLFLDQFQTVDVILERLAIYQQAIADCGREYDPLGVAVARALHITRNDEEREAAIVERMKMLDAMNQYGRSRDGTQKSSMVSDDNLRIASEESALMGTPDDIIARLLRMREAGVEYVLLTNATEEGLRTFSEEIMPAVA